MPEMVKCSPEEFPNFGKSSDEVESSLNRIELNLFYVIPKLAITHLKISFWNYYLF